MMIEEKVITDGKPRILTWVLNRCPKLSNMGIVSMQVEFMVYLQGLVTFVFTDALDEEIRNSCLVCNY